MKVTWDEEEGYHRLSDDNFSALVTELDQLEEKDIKFICVRMNIICHANRKRLFSEIRKKAMDIYTSRQRLYTCGGEASPKLIRPPPLPERDDRLNLKESVHETTLKHPPPLPKPISSFKRITQCETPSNETESTFL